MPQIIDKPISEMNLTELRQERQVHVWQAVKSKRGSEALQKRLFWLEENEPIYTREEIQQAYEAGRLSDKQYKTAFARRARAINYRRRAEHRAEYSRRVEDEERGIIAEIDERILMLEANAPKPKRGRPCKHDPRKRHAPKRKVYEIPRSHNMELQKRRWALLSRITRKQEQVAPIQNWNQALFWDVAHSRGYYTENGIIWYVSNELQLPFSTTKNLLQNGNFTFGQALVVGAFLQMTPREFCDVFLHDYFVDFTRGMGAYEAYVSDKQSLIDAPIRTPKKENA